MLQNIQYELHLSPRRRTISISIKPDLKVKVRAPKKMKQQKIANFVEEKQEWIVKKLEEFKAHKMPDVNVFKHEGKFLFLGEQYTILLSIHEGKNQVVKKEGVLEIRHKEASNPQEVLEKWFKAQAKQLFEERLDACFAHFKNFHKCFKPQLSIRKMVARYGSLSLSRGMLLNTKLIHVDIDLIDYVIMHELCHIKHQDHSKNFYALMTAVMPNWKIYKDELTALGMNIL